MTTTDAKAFYDREFDGKDYGKRIPAEQHHHYHHLKAFIERCQLADKKCLEIGCGYGALQDMVSDYTGVDIAESVRPLLHKPFFQCSADALPFPDSSFDAAWSITVLEHVPNPEKSLEEARVLKDGAFFYLAPAWQCRSWFADGYPVRPYSDFNFWGKLIKASIPIRNSVAFRSLKIFPRRVLRMLAWLIHRKPTRFRCGTLRPNYEHFWMTDSDAVNSMDPFEAILWFRSRGDECVSHPTGISQFLIRTGVIVFRIRKQ